MNKVMKAIKSAEVARQNEITQRLIQPVTASECPECGGDTFHYDICSKYEEPAYRGYAFNARGERVAVIVPSR